MLVLKSKSKNAPLTFKIVSWAGLKVNVKQSKIVLPHSLQILMHYLMQNLMLGCILILASAFWRSSCSPLCWLGRGHGTQSIPSASSWHTSRTARRGYRRVAGQRNQEVNQQVPWKVPTNRPTGLPPRSTSLAARAGRKKSGSVTSCLRPWMRRETDRGLADVCLDQVCNALPKASRSSIHTKCDMCVDYGLCAPVLCLLKPNPWEVADRSYICQRKVSGKTSKRKVVDLFCTDLPSKWK